MYSLYEINSNPQFAPIGYKTEFLTRINKDKVMNDLLDWFENPYMLYTYEKDTGGFSGGDMCLMGLTKEQVKGWRLMKEFDLENPEYKKMFIDHISPRGKEEILNKLKLEKDYNGHRIINKLYCIDRTYKEYGVNVNPEKCSILNFEIKTTLYVDKYERLSDFGAYDLPRAFHKDSPLTNAVRAFNVIKKEFKLMQESKRDYYTKWFSIRPFFAFEECGIEVLYARKGYSIDGKRMPSFNRGSVYGLKQSLKENKIKQKGLSKKDDIIKVLMKM